MRRLARDESGAALALALAFLSLFGVSIGAILALNETGFRAGRALSAQGDEATAIDGAVDGAINRLRGDIDAGREGSDVICFEPPALNGVTVTVDCEGQPGSGLEPTIGPQPQHAILTLGSGVGGEDGIEQTSPGTLAVDGGIFSNSTIDVAGDVTVEGDAEAIGNCTGSLTATGAVRCANTGGGANPDDGLDPNYPAVTATVPTLRSVPACGSGWLVSFQPGTYVDADALTTLMGGSCPKVFHFQPGAYYFQFRESAGSHVWRINDANVDLVGGTAAGWDPGAASEPTITMPGSCDEDGAGVQFIFGGDSRLRVDAGRVELCGAEDVDGQRIAVYGLKTGSVTTTTATATPSGATSTQYATPTNALAIDGSVAQASIPATNPGSSAEIALTGFAGVPSGDVITSATLRVAHADTTTPNVSSIEAIVTPAGGSAITVPIPTAGSLTTHTVDLLENGLDAASSPTGFSVTYRVRAKTNKAVTSQLDGIQIQLVHGQPGFEAQSGCLVATPFTGSGTPCAALRASGASTRLYVQGTVYVPLSAVFGDVAGAMRFSVGRGVVARHVRFAVASTSSQADPFFALERAPRTDREVLLTALVDGVERLRALVVFADGGGSTPGATVTIEQWSVVR